MLLETETVLPRKARRCIGACVLVALTLAAAACTDGDDPSSAAEGGHGDAEAARDVDASVSAEGSTGADASADAASRQPELDAAIDEAAAFDVTSSDTEEDDAGSTDTASDAQSEDVGIDSTTGDATVADSLDSPPDVDASVPDDGANTVPIFSNCTYASAIGEVPYAIIDATLSGFLGVSFCHCSWEKRVAEHRVLCGSIPPERVVAVTRWGCADPGGGRSIVIIRPPLMCSSRLEFPAVAYPLTDWDALLAEQIAGHTDSGSSDAHTAADGATGDSAADGAADDAFSDSDSAAGD
jgi:hypothetical protein